jgi:transposase
MSKYYLEWVGNEVRKQYIVKLSDAERKELREVVSKGKAKAYRIKHANILLASDIHGPGWQDKEIAQAFSINFNTVARLRKQFVEKGLALALGRKPQVHPSRRPKLDGEAEAWLIAIGCSEPPEGYSQWSLRLLAQRMVELEIRESVSYETIRRTLKKMNLSRICANIGSFPRTKMENL